MGSSTLRKVQMSKYRVCSHQVRNQRGFEGLSRTPTTLAQKFGYRIYSKISARLTFHLLKFQQDHFTTKERV